MTAINPSNKTFMGQNSLRIVTASVVTLTSIACIIIGTLGLSGVIPSIGTGGSIGLLVGGLTLFVGQLIYLVKTKMRAPHFQEHKETWPFLWSLMPNEFFVYYDLSKQKNKIVYRTAQEASKPEDRGLPLIINYLKMKCLYREISIDALKSRDTSTHDSN